MVKIYQHRWWCIAPWRGIKPLNEDVESVWFFGIWVTKSGADVVDVSLHCSLARLCCVVPCDVYTSKFDTCPIGGDRVVPAERFDEMISMNLINIFNNKIIHNEDKEYWTPFVSP